MRTEPPVRGLYLHGGPGITAEVERRWFGPSVPLDWWDQPRVGPDVRAPLDALIEATGRRLRALTRACGAPVPIVSHSIGAVLAARVLEDLPQLVSSVTLINPIFNLTHALVCLARGLVATGRSTDALSSALAQDFSDTSCLPALAGALGGVPGRFDLYWAPASARAKERYLALAPTGPASDAYSFIALGTAIDRSARLHLDTDVPVVAFVGASDPMMSGDVEDYVHARLPRARVITIDAGHMAPFEQPARVLGVA